MLLFKCLIKNFNWRKSFCPLYFTLFWYMCPQTNKKLSFSRKIACSEFSACNVVSMFKRGLYTVKNYGLKRNCSVSIIYPERIQLLSVDVGVTGHFRQQEGEFGIRSKVKEKKTPKHTAMCILITEHCALRTSKTIITFELLISKEM